MSSRARHPATPAWSRHLIAAEEHWRRAQARGGRGFRPLADREFRAALDRIPPDREAHVALLDVAHRLGRLEELKELYWGRYESLPFREELQAMIRALELARAMAEAPPRAVTHRADWLQFGAFILGAKAMILWAARRWIGPRLGPPLAAVLLFSAALYLLWPFLREMYQLIAL